MKPRLLDLFCCEGGASMGYYRAGWDVTGVDILPRFAKRYPFRFVAANALEYAADHWREYDAIHASPPCQAYSIATLGSGKQGNHPRLVEPTREALAATGLPYVIENVPRAPLLNPITLCGSMFDLTATDDDGTKLRLERHRLFESNVWLTSGECAHDKTIPVGGVYSGGRTDRREAREIRKGGYTPAKHVREALMGIDWMTLHGLSQSLPPAYTEFIGAQLLDHLVAS